jgi:transposase-like protein
VSKSRTNTRWTREFKLAALSRMDETVRVAALADELGVGQERLYEWRRKYRSGGSDALRPMGRPSKGCPPFEEMSAPSSSGATGSDRRIEELERKIGQQQLDLDFFRAALRHVRERRLKSGEPGETPSTR